MNQSDVPARFNIPFANNAGGAYIRSIPDGHQNPTGSDAPASLYDGFPPECFQDIALGGIPPSGKDFNGILKRLSEWARWQAAGGPAIFNSGYASAIGGYPKGAVLASTATDGLFWVSTANGNATDPDGGSPANWKGFGPALTLSFDGSNNWRRVAADGFVEMGGIASFGRWTEGSFSLTFPFSGFPTACLGMTAMTRGSGSPTGATFAQELSLSATMATLYLQSDESSPIDTNGTYRWRAWGY